MSGLAWGCLSSLLFTISSTGNGPGISEKENTLRSASCRRFLSAFFLFYKHQRNKRTCRKSPYDLCLLGICPDVSASWNPLAYDNGSDRKTVLKIGQRETAAYKIMDPASFGRSGGAIWALCICEKEYRKLFFPSGTFCFL